MKAKSKSSKKVTKKPVAKKTVTSTIKKKKASAKPVKKITTAKKTRKASPKKTAKSLVAKKKAVSATQKKKTPIKPAKRSAPIKKQAAAEIPMTIIEETIVTVTTTLPDNEFPTAPSPSRLVGIVTQYHNLFSMADIDLEIGTLSVGETIHFKGDITDFEQVIESLKIDHESVETAEEGQIVEVKVRDVVQENDKVYKID
jgi:hypothetical protein